MRSRNGVTLPPVFFVTDPVRTPEPVALARGLPAGWGVIYRHFGASDRKETAVALAETARRRKLTLFISADPQLADTVGADGVHWPERLASLRRLHSCGQKLVTVSAHSRRGAQNAYAFGADAALVSTVFKSKSVSAGPALGVHRFARAIQAAPLPCYGLGGISAETAARISAFAGLACVEGIVQSVGVQRKDDDAI